MTYVIAEPCIGTKDTACVDACPVDCIHPKKNTTYDDGRTGFDEVPQLYIDPVECIDREVEALHGTQRKLRPKRQIHTARIRQVRGEVDATGRIKKP